MKYLSRIQKKGTEEIYYIYQKKKIKLSISNNLTIRTILNLRLLKIRIE